MATSRPTPSKPLDLDLTIVSAKHLKNINWRNGDLSPYAIFWVDPDRRLSTKSDDSGSTRPVWNERFLIPIPLSLSLNDAVLTIELFHSKPSDTPKPLIGTIQFPIKDLVDPDDSTKLRTFDLRLPSGRPQGKIRLKLSLRDWPVPDYPITPQPNYYYSTAPPPLPTTPPLPRDYRGYPSSPSPYTSSLPPPQPQPPQSYPYGSYNSDPYSGYYSNPGGYYSQPPPPPPRPFFDRTSSYGGGPSAPVDYAQYDQKPKSGKMGMGLGTGLAVGAVAGALGGLAIEEGLKYEEDKIADRVENDLAARDDYSDYRVEY